MSKQTIQNFMEDRRVNFGQVRAEGLPKTPSRTIKKEDHAKREARRAIENRNIQRELESLYNYF